MIWYGLAGEEARRRCLELGKEPYFTMTLDPRLVSVDLRELSSAGEAPVREDSKPLSGVLRVIRALESNSDIYFTLGLFISGIEGDGEGSLSKMKTL